MHEQTRPNPDDLLAAIQKDEARQGRGKLKIFFGMAAGVGKTYAMLEAARSLKDAGVDVVVGYVETHKRLETEALIAGLEVIPRQKVEYRGTVIDEMDTDAIIERHPNLVLVDELAHTNAPGVRHVKRWQDVVEILQAGIDVYTTVNVQHFESRTDAVQQITGIVVRETVPDSLLDRADEIELIDLSPEQLRKRLAEGKVYTPERVETAAGNFFRTGNLTALREMSLRLTAEHVDHKLRDYMEAKRIAWPWKSGERLLVGIGPSPFSEHLVRWTRRMAYTLEAPWIALYVETSNPLSVGVKAQVEPTLALVRSLGGEVVTTVSSDVNEALLRIARQRNVTQIVIGKPRHTPIQSLLRGGSLVDRIIRASGDIDIYVVTGDKLQRSETNRRFQMPQATRHSEWKHYIWAVGIIALVTAVNLLAYSALPWLGYQVVGLTDLFAVLLIAVYIGRGPALLAAAVSAISWNFLFITPRLTLEVSKLQDLVLLVLYFAIALIAGNLTARIRVQERAARRNAERNSALYRLAHETATALNMDDILTTAVTQIANVFDARVAILLTRGETLDTTAHPASTYAISEKEYSVARWVYENRKTAGRYTDTLPLAAAQYFPLLTPSLTVGVIGISLRRDERLSFDKEVLLETFINQVALVIERELLSEAAGQSAMLQESERLYSVLLNSISHELRTPIATIVGAASGLIDPSIGASQQSRLDLTEDIQSAANRLNRLVENLLDMSRLESGRMRLKLEWCDVGDIIGVAAKRFDSCFSEHPFRIQLQPELPLVQLDYVLIEQVLVNLIDNACNYTPAGTPITLSAQRLDAVLEIAVSDHGPGLPADDFERVFEKFYRVKGSIAGGTGLGLSICRGLVEAHGGTMSAGNNPDGGARFTIRLPAASPPPPVREAAV